MSSSSSDIIAFLFWLFIPLILSAFGVYLIRRFLISHDIMDQPNKRSSHKIPTPRGGGLAFMPVIIIFGGLYAFLAGQTELLKILGLTTFLCLFTWFDDRKGLPAGLRLIIQAITVAAALFFVLPANFQILPAFFPEWLSAFLLFFGWLWFINLFNFMDGIDGISVTEGVSIALGLIVLALFHVPFMLVIMGALLGFLIQNWPPAKIFMGDVGSIGLGFLLGYLLIRLAGFGLAGFYAALIIPLYYWMDASLTLCRRLIKREKIWEAHRQHFYQMATTDDNRTHRRVVVVLFGCNLGLIGCAVLAALHGWSGLLAAFVLVGLVLLMFSRGIPFYLNPQNQQAGTKGR